MSIQDIAKRAVLALGFEERTGLTAFDSSPKANNGTLKKSNGVLPQWVAGQDGFGGALDFDGVGAYAEVPHSSSITFTSEDFTIIFRAKLTYGVNDVILCKGYANADGWYIVQRAANKLDFVVNQPALTSTVTGDNAFTGDTWFDCVVVRRGEKAYIYVNGLDKTVTQPTITGLVASTRVLYIGRYDDPGANEIIGALDDILILPYALTPAEIRALYESRSAFTATPNLRRGLVLDMDFQEGAWLTVFDRSWYAHNGVLMPGSDSIANENFTSDYDTPVQLKHTNITPGTTNVTDNGTTYTEGVDYTMDNPNGTITVLSTGGMADATGYLIDYDYAGSYPTWVAGGGLDFDGIDDFVDLGDYIGLEGATAFSIIQRVYLAAGYSEDGALCNQEDAVYNQIQDNLTPLNTIHGAAGDYAPYTFTTERWYDVAHCFDGSIGTGTKYYYVDGRLIQAFDIGIASVPFSTFNAGIGSREQSGTWVYFFKGIIKKVRVYNRNLTPAEHRAIHEEWS